MRRLLFVDTRMLPAVIVLASVHCSSPHVEELPYHPAPTQAIPSVLMPGRFEDPVVRAVYQRAAAVRDVLYQQPCLCYCNRSLGHRSLLDCFTGPHGSRCTICQKEAVYCYLQSQKHKTPSEIRVEVLKGAWRTLNVESVLNMARGTTATPPNPPQE